mmetsp:Transcript_3692/g.8822  ORF Transcript_3692/g.8822 Transcript_3692/m.8822 type:complete len:276 (-) Transcript_3692:228-1055(-)
MLDDFFFETSASDVPPARLLANAPGTPSPTASGVRRIALVMVSSLKVSHKAKGLKVATGGKSGGGVSKKTPVSHKKGGGKGGDSAASTPKNPGGGLTPKTPGGKSAMGGARSVRDSLGGLLSPLSFGGGIGGETPSRASARISVKATGGHSRGVRAFLRDSLKGVVSAATGGGGGGSHSGHSGGAGTPGSPPTKVGMSRSDRASAQPVELETFKRWKAGGLLESAISKVLARASTVGKSIRGSSLVMQVEQALGVGSGALRSHGDQIQTMAKRVK